MPQKCYRERAHPLTPQHSVSTMPNNSTHALVSAPLRILQDSVRADDEAITAEWTSDDSRTHNSMVRDLTERYANKTISELPGLLVGLRGGARRWALKRGLMWVLEMQLMRLVGRNGRRGGQVEAGVVARRTRSESQTHPRSMLSGENRMIESFGMNRPRLQFRMRARSQLSLTNLGARRAQ